MALVGLKFQSAPQMKASNNLEYSRKELHKLLWFKGVAIFTVVQPIVTGKIQAFQ